MPRGGWDTGRFSIPHSKTSVKRAKGGLWMSPDQNSTAVLMEHALIGDHHRKPEKSHRLGFQK